MAEREDVAAMRATIQRHNETIEALHTAAQSYKTRLTQMEAKAAQQQAELDSLRPLADENATLRKEHYALTDRNRELEEEFARRQAVKQQGTDSAAQAAVKLQAYQRHNHFLQGEVSSRDAKVKQTQDRLDVARDDVLQKERRITMLVEKLRQMNVDPHSAVAKVQVPEQAFSSMKEQLVSQSAALEVLRDKLESLQEDAVRREEVLKAQRKENDALRGTVSRLVSQLAGTDDASLRAPSASSPDPEGGASKLQAFHRNRIRHYTAAE